MAADRAMRASDQDRESAPELLRQTYIEGRLSREELDERAAAVYSATTWGELLGDGQRAMHPHPQRVRSN